MSRSGSPISAWGSQADLDFLFARAAGGSGTLDWTPPEAFIPDIRTGKLPAPDRTTDQWALGQFFLVGEQSTSLAHTERCSPFCTLGLILHLLSFFTLPYHNESDNDLLEQEIRTYKGSVFAERGRVDRFLG